MRRRPAGRRPEPPAAPPPSPRPPTARQAAAIVTEAWQDPGLGALIWLAMTTGAHRGALCAMRWNDIDFASGEETLWIARAIKKSKAGWVEGPTKSHQQRRVALDPETVLILHETLQRAQHRAAQLAVPLAEDAFVFSLAPDHRTFCRSDTVSQRYERMVARFSFLFNRRVTDAARDEIRDAIHAVLNTHGAAL